MGNANGILLIRAGSIFAFLITIYFFITVERGYDQSTINIYIGVAVILLILQGFYNFVIKGQKSWFQIDIMFLIMFFLVHFWLWISLQYQFGNFEELPRNYLRNVNYSVALSLIGMSSFILGFNLKPSINQQSGYVIESPRKWNNVGNTIFYIGAALTASYILYFGSQAFEGGYTGSEVGNLLTRSIYLL